MTSRIEAGRCSVRPTGQEWREPCSRPMPCPVHGARPVTPRTEAGLVLEGIRHLQRERGRLSKVTVEDIATLLDGVRRLDRTIERGAAALDVERLARADHEWSRANFGVRCDAYYLPVRPCTPADHYEWAESILSRLAAESTLRVDPHRFVDGVCPTCHYSDRFSHMTAHDARLAAEPSEPCDECGGAGGVLTDEHGYTERDVCASCHGSGLAAGPSE